MTNIYIQNNTIKYDEIALMLEEYDDRFIIYGKIPGTGTNPININYENEYITITYTRSIAQSVGFMSIQQTNSESKRFYVPNVEPSKLSGTFENEMLSVIIPKIINEVYLDSEIIDVESINEILE